MIFEPAKKKSQESANIIKNSSTRVEFLKLLGLLFIILAIHAVAMVFIEGMRVDDAIWLTMTSATTVGYGDFSAKTIWGRISTVVLLYIGGIAILTKVIAMYFEHRQEVREKMLTGNWSWGTKNHIVFINCPETLGEEYFYQAIFGLRQSKADLSQMPIIIIHDGFKNGLPNDLKKLNISLVSKPNSQKEAFEAANVKNAHTIVVLSRDQTDPVSDSINFEIVDRLRELGVTARIIAEVVKDTNRNRIRRVGANNVLRPIRAYPELLMRAIIAPGSEQVIETIFDSFGEECIRYDIDIRCKWIEIMHKLTQQDLGVPVAYEDVDGNIFNIPPSQKMVDVKALFVIVHVENIKKSKDIKSALKDINQLS